MALNALTLPATQGLIDRPFKQLVGGLTAGSERRVSSGFAGGFYMQGDYLCNDSLGLNGQGVSIAESTLTESRTTDLTVTARREFAVKAEAEASAGGAISQFRVYPNADTSGTSWDYAYETPIGATRTVRLAGGGNLVNFKQSNTTAIRAALAQSARNVVVPCIGPSTTAGQSTGAGTSQAVISWPMQAATILQSRGINAGANNWFGDKGRWGGSGGVEGLTSGDARLSFTGATARAGADSAGGNPIAFAGTGTFGFTPQGQVTKIDVFFRNSAAVGQVNSSIDGGSAIALTATNASPSIKKVTVDAGTAGIHSQSLSWVSGTVFVIGASGYDDTAGRREISFYNWGISGAPSSRFLLNASNGIGNLAFTEFVAPDAIILDDLPINDWRQNVTLATSRANVTALVQHAKSTGATVILTTPLWDANTGALSPQQNTYAQMVYDVAIEQDVLLIDIRAAWVSYAFSNADGRYSDSVHPTQRGYYIKALAIAEAIQAIRSMPSA